MGRKKGADHELVRLLKQGEERAFLQLVERYSNRVYALALRYTKHPEDAEEVLQDVFLTVFRKIKNFEGKSAFSSWLFRVTVNAALMHLRKKKGPEQLSLDEMLSLGTPDLGELTHSPSDGEQGISRHELRQAIGEAVKKLPAEYRAVFVLRDIDELTGHEVSSLLHLSVAAVKSRLHRARLMLRNDLSEFRVQKDLSDPFPEASC